MVSGTEVFDLFGINLCLCFARVSVSWSILIRYSARNSVPLILFRNQLQGMNLTNNFHNRHPNLLTMPLGLGFTNWLCICNYTFQTLFSHALDSFIFEFCSWDAAFVLVCLCWSCNLFRWQLHGADNWLNSYGNSRERKTRKFWANKFNKWLEQTQARERYQKYITMFSRCCHDVCRNLCNYEVSSRKGLCYCYGYCWYVVG